MNLIIPFFLTTRLLREGMHFIQNMKVPLMSLLTWEKHILLRDWLYLMKRNIMKSQAILRWKFQQTG